MVTGGGSGTFVEALRPLPPRRADKHGRRAPIARSADHSFGGSPEE